MTLSAPQYILDSKGAKTSVIRSLKDYEKILEMIEDLEDVELYDEVKSRNEERISLSDYISKRKNTDRKSVV